MWGKVTLFEDCARVPLIIRAPATTQSGKSHELVELVDIFPTLAALCSLETPPHLQGRSFVPLLTDPSARGRDTAYTVVSRGKQLGRSIRTERWRFARWPRGGEELYDLEKDPAEETNLASLPEHRELMNSLRAKLSQAEATAAARR